MPGPYCSAADVYSQTQARLGQAAESELPEHWDKLGSKARLRGYQRMIGILTGRGYSVAAIDTWSGRAVYNLDYAVAYAFGYGGFRKGEDDNNSDLKELARIDKELSGEGFLLTDDSGGVLLPDLNVGSGTVSRGRNTTYDDDAADILAWKAGFIDDDGTIYEPVKTK